MLAASVVTNVTQAKEKTIETVLLLQETNGAAYCYYVGSSKMFLFCIHFRPCLSIIDKKFYGKSNSIFFCNHNSNEITFYCCRPIISSHCGFNGNNNRIFAEQNIYKSNFINNKKRNGMWIHTFFF